MPKQTSPRYRISNAALGKRLAAVIELDLQGSIPYEEFHDTVIALYKFILDPTFEPTDEFYLNDEIYEEQRLEIEKSARRSQAAREAALRRKEQREASRDSLDRNRPASVTPPSHDVASTGCNHVDDEEIVRQVRACVRKQIGPYPHRYKTFEPNFRRPASVWDVT